MSAAVARCLQHLPRVRNTQGFRASMLTSHRRDFLSASSCRYVSTLSPLASAFNSKPEKKLDLRAAGRHAGMFGIPQLVDYTGFYLLKEGVYQDTDDLVQEVTSPNRSRKMVEVFDQLSDCLCRVADMADFTRVAHPDQKFSQAAEDACISITGLVEKLNTNVNIYNALMKVIEKGDKFETDAVDRRVAELFQFDFEQSGIHLPPEKRSSFVDLNEKILMLGTYFMQGSQRPIAVPKQKLPDHLKYVFAIDGDSVIVNGLFADHHNELVREAAYKIYLYPDQHQEDLLVSLLTARDNVANLVGFPTYAHRALRGTMGQSPEYVRDFLDRLAEALKHRALKDFKEMKILKAENGSLGKDIMPWDTGYYSGLARHSQCRMDTALLAPYFSLGNCMEGLNLLFQSLYGVTLENVKPDYGELWSPDVLKLAVVHETEGTLGYIYCDFFERAGKPHQDCHFTIKGGRLLEDGTYQDPVVVVMMNLPPSRGHTPSLLTPGMVENLFHECGHALHSMMGRTRYQHVTGTRCPTDFAEVPSVLMEYFATDPRVLRKFAYHWQTREPLAEETIDNLCKAKKMFAASEMQVQVFYSVLDQIYHGKHPLGKSAMDILADTQNKYYTLPHVPGTAWHLRFGHFVGYGAKYYSYLMSRAVASRIWHQCFRHDPFNRTMGDKYRRDMLAHGGSKHPVDLVEGMLGEKPTTDMLVKALMDDLDEF